MNILWLSHFVPYPPMAGQILRSYNLIRELSRSHDVHLLVLNQKALHPTPKDVHSAVEVLSRLCASVKVLDVPCERSTAAMYRLLVSNLVKRIPYSVQRVRTTEMGQSIIDLLTHRRIDLVHFDTIELAEFMIQTEGKLRTMTHHNIESQLLRRRAKLAGNPLKRWYIRHQAEKLQTYEDAVLEQFDYNLTVSDLDTQTLQQRFPGMPATTISNGVDTEFFHPNTSHVENDTLVFVGNMGWFPNHDAANYFVRQVWPMVLARNPSARLYLVGPGEKNIEPLASAPGVSVTGLVDDVRPYLHRATAVIVPIRVGGGTRLKILDALACGKAVISTRIGCEGIDASHGRHILFADSEEAFCSEIMRVMSDSQLRERLGSEGRILVEEQFAWSSIGAKLDKLYQSL